MAKVIYGEEAKELWQEGCASMYQRMGWEFDENLEDAIGELFAENGMVLDSDKSLMYITDNAFVNGDWGVFSDSDEYEEFLKQNRKENFLILNKNCWVKSL